MTTAKITYYTSTFRPHTIHHFVEYRYSRGSNCCKYLIVKKGFKVQILKRRRYWHPQHVAFSLAVSLLSLNPLDAHRWRNLFSALLNNFSSRQDSTVLQMQNNACKYIKEIQCFWFYFFRTVIYHQMKKKTTVISCLNP